MTAKDNKTLVQRFFETVMTERNTDTLVDFCVAGSMFAGGIAGQVKATRTAFPDAHHSR